MGREYEPIIRINSQSGKGGATKYLADLGGEWQTATNQVAASTGAAGKELEGLRDVMEDVYAANYGDSVADVGDAVAMVNRNMANLDQNGLTAATEGALALRLGATVEDLISTIHSHPTVSEAVREAALNVEKRAIHSRN